MAPTMTSGRLLAALEGCYEAPRAAALSGVPVSTVYYWARRGIIVPTVSPTTPKRWSYADLMALRLVYWLRHPKTDQPRPVPASPMGEVRRALVQLNDQGLDIWSSESLESSSPLRVDPTGQIYVSSSDRVETTRREGVFEESLDLLGTFQIGTGFGPDLVRPRPHLRIVPGKVSGEPHLADSRITTQAVSTLYERLRNVDRVTSLYPEIDPASIREAIELERDLAAQVDLPLDHNFPEPILDCLDEFIPEVDLIPLRRIHRKLPLLDDRALLIALHQLGYSGLVTNNYKMLQNPRELAAVLRTKLTVFAIEGVGHDPIRATGALLLDLPSATGAMSSGFMGVFWLRPRRPRPQDPWELFRRAAQNRSEEPSELYDVVKVSDLELNTPLT